MTAEHENDYKASISADAFARANEVIRKAVSIAGTALSQDGFLATIAQFAPLQAATEPTEIERDIGYGPDARHKLDWFHPSKKAAGTPSVIIYVHGGGFVGGDKREPNSPLYDNIGSWAAANGLHAVTLTYRLAPQHQWPTAGEDVRDAMVYVIERMKTLIEGDFNVYLMGHSAGAVHAATAATVGSLPDEVAGCILLSGFYDNTIGKPNPNYFGDQPENYPSQSSLAKLAAADVPLFIGVAEFDPALMHRNAAALVQARVASGKPIPQFVLLYENSHFSTVLLINSVVDTLGPRLLEFMARPSAVSLAN
jgi:triacylglycerol lipase